MDAEGNQLTFVCVFLLMSRIYIFFKLTAVFAPDFLARNYNSELLFFFPND